MNDKTGWLPDRAADRGAEIAMAPGGPDTKPFAVATTGAPRNAKSQ